MKLKFKKKIMNELMNEFVITEGVMGYWYYHISKKGNETKSLCGKPTMISYLPFSAWGFKSHLNERYCKKCKDMVDF